MLKLNNLKTIKFRGQKLTKVVLFLNAVQHCNGKDVIMELYPYLSEETRKDDAARNHLRHEVFYLEAKKEPQLVFADAAKTEVKVDESGAPVTQNVTVEEWKLLEDLKIETPGHLEFFAGDVWQMINAEVKKYLVELGICSENEIIEV